MQRLNIPGVSLILLCFPAFGAAAVEEYYREHFNAIYPQETATWEIKIRSAGTSNLTKIQVHSSLLNRFAPGLAAPFAEGASPSVPYVFERQEEESAFKKIIYFVYNYDPKQMGSQRAHLDHFFEPESLADLILLTHKFQIKGLGTEVERFLREQINKKISTEDDVKIWLDQLSDVQLFSLHKKIFVDIQAQQPWLNSITNSLEHYNCYIFLNEDPRLKGVQMTFDPNVHSIVSAALRKKHKKLEAARRSTAQERERERQENERRREESEFETLAKEKASHILEQFRADLLRKNSYDEPIKKHRYRVPKKFAHRVANILKPQLIDFVVDVPVYCEKLNKDSGLSQDCTKCDSCEYCCAESTGWACCLCLYPAQLLTYNYLWCCTIGNGRGAEICEGRLGFYDNSSTCCCSTQLGVAVRNCVYEVVSCHSRWITITPREHENKLIYFPAPPPQLSFWE